MCGFHKAQFLCSLGLAVVLLAGCGTTAASLLASSAPAAASAAAPAGLGGKDALHPDSHRGGRDLPGPPGV